MKFLEKKAKKIPLDSGELSSGWFLERDVGSLSIYLYG